jgi:hypothetical protein
LQFNNLELQGIVLAENWPSFFFVLQSTGFNIETFVIDNSVTNDLILRNLFINPRKLLKAFSEEFISSDTSIWIQGESKFLSSLLDKIPNSLQNVAAVISNSGRKVINSILQKNSNSGLLSHISVGGLTHGRWSYLVPKGVDTSSINSKGSITRRLKHFLNQTEKGIPYGSSTLSLNKRKSIDEKVYTGDNNVLPGERKLVVTTHCVKQSTTPLIKRYITPHKLLDIYDVQSPVHDCLTQLSNDSLNTYLSGLVKSAPEK